MFDRREAILAQLEVILGSLSTTVAPFAAVFRNRADLKETARPAVVLLDNAETVVHLYNSQRGTSLVPMLVELKPQIWVVLKVRDKEKSNEYGPELSAYRLTILSALFNDAVLSGLIEMNGKIEYRGFDSDMAIHATMQGQTLMSFGITYILRPEDLT